MANEGMVRELVEDRIPERTTPRLQFRCVDASGTTIPSPDTITLTVHCAGEVIGSADRDISDFVAAGVGDLYLTLADTQVLDSTVAVERHTALIAWTWDSGQKAGKYEVEFDVVNLLAVS